MVARPIKHLIIIFSLICNCYGEIQCFRDQLAQALAHLDLLEDPSLIRFCTQASADMCEAYFKLNPDERTVVDYVFHHREVVHMDGAGADVTRAFSGNNRSVISYPEDIKLSINMVYSNNGPALLTILRHELEHIIDLIKFNQARLPSMKQMEIKAYSAQYDLYRRSFTESDVKKIKELLMAKITLNQAEEQAISKYIRNDILDLFHPDLLGELKDKRNVVLGSAYKKEINNVGYRWFLTDFEDAMTLDKTTYLAKKLSRYGFKPFEQDHLEGFLMSLDTRSLNTASTVLVVSALIILASAFYVRFHNP